ncbi:hypothetical protein GF322_04260 [Candidatus Dependentiae bacterium]|nr:hypothetical protein [Candidatus Dependentiae bacterium]
MKINLTLFVQIINFYITYYFLNNFMYKPVTSFLNKQKQKESEIKKNLDKKEKELLELENAKKIDLISFKEEIDNKYQFKPFEVKDIPTQIPFKIDRQQTDKITKIVKEKLVKEVPHVD